MLQLHHISKTFGRGTSAIAALSDVSLTVRTGTATALLGENGAGKTTLMNVLAGLIRPDRGEITLDGELVKIHRPQDARRLGLGMVHQHFKLVEAMTVAENVALVLPDLPWPIRPAAVVARVEEAARQFRLDLDPRAPVERLSLGQRQRVEILKVLMQRVRYLILDEPTSVLTPQEAEDLFAIVRRLCAEGLGVVFITHRLQEVSAVCKFVTVLRRGVVTHEGTVDEATTANQLAEWMVGKNEAALLTDGEPTPAAPDTPGNGSCSGGPQARAAAADDGTRPRAPVVLHVENLTVPSPRRHAKPPVENVALEINAGEVLGLAGVDGNGQRELCEALCGLRRAVGSVLLNGTDISSWPPARRFAAGVAHIADDRQREGLILPMTLAENLALKAHTRRGYSRAGWLHVGQWREQAELAIRTYGIKATGPQVPVAGLSGGNQQKVILARELGFELLPIADCQLPIDRPFSSSPRLVVAMNPARGLDVAAARFVYEQITRLKNSGAGILLVSADLDDLFAWSDRLAVIYAGRVTLTDWPKATRTEIGRLMLGAK